MGLCKRHAEMADKKNPGLGGDMGDAEESFNVVYLVAELARLRGIEKIVKNPGLTAVKIDDSWEAKINPHKETVENIPASTFSFVFNGWPAGMLNPDGEGVLCHGEAANKDTLRDALLAAIRKEKQGTGGTIHRKPNTAQNEIQCDGVTVVDDRCAACNERRME